MYTVYQTLTFLEAAFGDALSRFLALFSRGSVKECDVEVGNLPSDAKAIESTGLHNVVPVAVPAAVPDVESATVEPAERTSPETLSAAVAASLCALPSLPSLLKSPPARPSPATSNSVPEKQEFRQPSNLYYEHRLPFGNVTNLPRGEPKGMRLDNLQVKHLAPRKNRVKPKAKKARPVQIPVIVVVDTDVQQSLGNADSVTVFKPVAAPVLESVAAPLSIFKSGPAPVVVLDSVPALDTRLKRVSTPVLAPALGSVEWEREKAAALAQAQTWTDHVKTSRRVSLPAPAPIPVPDPVDVLPSKRHSAPPVLYVPRKSLQDRLSALLAATTETIAALDKDSEKTSKAKKGDVRIKNGGVPEIGEAIKEARRFSAIALEEGRQMFSIGEDSDDEDDEDIPLGELFEARRRRSDSIV
ncbi:hypothetical protein DFH06DRAFT_1290545 [Mycena polygramma]|nr:hypothetical protein DFH06DRAFT_1290545 [Mycena polygramma]